MKNKGKNSEPKKVFYMVYSLSSGGIEKYSINIFKYIDKKKYTLDFITKLDRKEFFDKKLFSMGGVKIPLAKKNSGFLNFFVLFFNAYKTVKRDYDLAYFNLSSPAAVFKYPLICKLAGMKRIVIHSHNSSEANIGLLGRFLNYLGRIYINHISSERFACSTKAAKWMFGKKITNQNKYIFVQNGIEVDKYKYNVDMREKIRRNLGFTKSDFVIGHIGRFEKQKNHQFLIRTFETLSKQDPNARLVLIGVGTLKNSIETLVKEKGLEKKVLFLGEQDNVNEILQAMDVFILPSLYEGLPVVGIEAQAAGLKCVFADTISEEADVTGNVNFVNLTSVNLWVKAIEGFKQYSRVDQSDNLIKAGYSIKETAQLVQDKFDLILSKN